MSVKARGAGPRWTVSLFWRTCFILISLILAVLGAAGLTWDALVAAPREQHQVGEALRWVHLARQSVLASVHAGSPRTAPVVLGDLTVRPRLESDRIGQDWLHPQQARVGRSLQRQLGEPYTVAASVDGVAGLWVGMTVDHGLRYWLRLPVPEEFVWNDLLAWRLWLPLLASTVLLSMLFARWLNQPWQALNAASHRFHGGALDSRLEENSLTSEIREVNVGFNRMASSLAKVEEERVVMLAGISHDLRTPLARLRLEVEMSVADPEAKVHMAQDIDQVDAIIDKFMDYARAGETKLVPVGLAQLADQRIAAQRAGEPIEITSRLAIDARVMADPVELGRVFDNLFENAKRYARGPDGIARVELLYQRSGSMVIITVRDHGPGVPPDVLANLTKPFYRADAARTSAKGAGLGLTIVEKMVQRMNGVLEISNAAPPDSGLVLRMRLRRAPGS